MSTLLNKFYLWAKGVRPRTEGPWPRRVVLGLITAITYFHFFPPPISIAFDPNEQQCLPDLHAVLLVKNKIAVIERGDYVFWKPTGSLSYIKQGFVLKRVSGIPGDHLVIKNNMVTINGFVVATGMALLDPKIANPKEFEKDEVIPPGSLFATGTHPQSNDSRYWGYLPTSMVEGKGYKII